MKQYLKITNQGLIVEEDLMLIGSSSKRDDNTKIGMFGSGWKYALAWLIRNECTPTIFSGTESIDVDFRATLHRNNPVRIITINGKDTSLTAEMGPQWDGWMAVREIVSNAIDEGSYTISTEMSPNMVGAEGITTVYIPMDRELQEMMMSYHKYFAFDREPAMSNGYGQVYLRTSKGSRNIYRKGIRCYNPSETDLTLLDFSFEDIKINESRLCESYGIISNIRNVLRAGNLTKEVLKAFLLDDYGDNSFPSLTPDIEDILVSLAKDGNTFTTHAMAKLVGIMANTNGKALVVSTEWYAKLVVLGYAKSLADMMGGGDTPFIVTNNRDTTMISHYLAKMNIHLPVVSGKFENYYDVLITDAKIVVLDNSSANDLFLAASAISRMTTSDIIKIIQ